MKGDPVSGGGGHLTEADFFTLAMPPAGDPEALPRHLSECVLCSRAFADWKGAVRDFADEGVAGLRHRSAEEWKALEGRTIAAIRSARIREPLRSMRWAIGIAASLLILALAVPLWVRRQTTATDTRTSRTVPLALSAQDQADDALLRDVAKLARAEDETTRLWSSLAPEPSAGDDDRL